MNLICLKIIYASVKSLHFIYLEFQLYVYPILFIVTHPSCNKSIANDDERKFGQKRQHRKQYCYLVCIESRTAKKKKRQKIGLWGSHYSFRTNMYGKQMEKWTREV